MNYLLAFDELTPFATALNLASSFGPVTGQIEKLNVVMIDCDVSALDQFRQIEGVISVSPETFAPPVVARPNDPYATDWHIDSIGLLNAWDYASGSGIVVASLDTGVRTTHEDLAPKLLSGRCVVTDTADVSAVHFHGTPVAGVLGAATGNGKGGVGVARDSMILPVRVTTNADGSSSLYRVSLGILWAVDNGARVISISISEVFNDPICAAAAKYARVRGCVVVAGGWNESVEKTLTNPDTAKDFICVGAYTSANARRWSWGDWLTVRAPEGITAPSTTSDSSYSNFVGNSSATPVVAGVCAMILSLRPDLGFQDVKQIIQQSANRTKLGGSTGAWTKYDGYGALDAAAAMALAANWVGVGSQSPAVVIKSPASADVVFAGQSVPVEVHAADDKAVSAVKLYANNQLQATLTAAPYTFSWTPSAVGSVELMVTVLDDLGQDIQSSIAAVNVLNPLSLVNAWPATLTLSGLTPTRDFEVRARFVNSGGDGPWSAWQTVQTLPQAPTLAPSGFIIERAGSDWSVHYQPGDNNSTTEMRIGAGAWGAVSNPAPLIGYPGPFSDVQFRSVNSAGASPPVTLNGWVADTTGDASGAILSALASLISGAATGAAIAGGVTTPFSASLVPGEATGAAAAAGVSLSLVTALTPGAATAGAVANAPGAVASVGASLVPGGATGEATAPGAMVSGSVAIVPGAGSGAAVAPGQPIATAASIVPGSASGAATAPGASLALVTTLAPGAATASAVANAPGAVVSAAASLVPGGATGAATAAGAMVSGNATLVSGAGSGAAAAPGQAIALAASIVRGAASGEATAAGISINASTALIPGAVTAGGTANAPGATLVATASIAPGAATGGAVAGGVVLAASSSLIPGAASAGAAGIASGAVFTSSLSLLPGAATGAAAASGQALSLGASLLPGAATAGAAGVAHGAIVAASASLSTGTASGAAIVPPHTWQAFLSLITGGASGESAGSQPASAPGAEFLTFLALLEGEASGVVLDDYPMKYATLADMVTRFGQAELVKLTDLMNVPPATIDTTRVQIAINDAQMEIDSAVGCIYRLPLAGCIRPPVSPDTEPTAVAPPQLTRLACDIARFFLYDDLSPENEVVRRYKQAKATLEDIAGGALQLTCPWGGSPGELIAADAQSGSPEAYDCFAPRQITDDTLRGF